MSNTATRFRNAILSRPNAPYQASQVVAKEMPDDLAASLWIVIDRISCRREAAHDGDGRMTDTLFQVTVGGPQRNQVETVKDFLIETLHGLDYSDPTGAIAILMSDESDGLESEPKVYTSQIDFRVLDNNT